MNVWDSQEVSKWWDNEFKNSLQSVYHDLSLEDKLNVKKLYCVIHESSVMIWYNDVMRTADSNYYHHLTDEERATMRHVYKVCHDDEPILEKLTSCLVSTPDSIRSKTYEVISIVLYMILIVILLYKIISHIFNQ